VRNGNVIITIVHSNEEKYVQAPKNVVDEYTKKGNKNYVFSEIHN
jgi:hypothetical protein